MENHFSSSVCLSFLPAADLPAPLPPPAGSAAAEAKLQGEQILSSQVSPTRSSSIHPSILPLLPPSSSSEEQTQQTHNKVNPKRVFDTKPPDFHLVSFSINSHPKNWDYSSSQHNLKHTSKCQHDVIGCMWKVILNGIWTETGRLVVNAWVSSDN